MNPISVNSSAVDTFGFTTTFDLQAGSIKFDISTLTAFFGGGQSAVKGIAFAVKDPSGLDLAVIDFNAPQINPALTSIFVLNLVSGFAKYGWYSITGTLKDADNTLYPITFKKEICEPKGINDSNVVPGSFVVMVDCNIPKLTIRENTLLVYKGLQPVSVTRAGILSYPPGTLNNLAFSTNSITITGASNLFTGRYTINNTTTARFDIGDQVFVLVVFKTTAQEKVINCQTELAVVLGCVASLNSAYQNDPYGNAGKAAKAKLDAATVLILIAVIKEKAGFDAGDDVAKISAILNCDCNCVDAPVSTL